MEERTRGLLIGSDANILDTPPIRRPWRGLPTHDVPPATVVPDPSIGLAECRIPYAVAREVWKPRIISQISSQGRGLEKARRYFEEGHWLAEHILGRMYEKRTTLVSLPAVDSRQTRVMALKTRRTNSPALHVHPLLAPWLKSPVLGERALPWHAQQFGAGLEAQPLDGRRWS